MAGIRDSTLTFALLLAGVLQYFGPVFAGAVGSTHIDIPATGLVAYEGSNVSLDCKIYGIRSRESFSCSKVLFLVNQTDVEASVRQPISADSQHSFSDADRSQTGKIICSLTISELTVADSGAYGCCWGDSATSRCSSDYPMGNLDVRPVTTIAPSTTEVSTTTTTRSPTTISTTSSTISTLSSDKKSSTPRPVIEYNSLPPKEFSTEKNGVAENEALSSNTSQSIHKTIWPILLIAAIIAVVVFVGYRYVKRQRTRDCDSGAVRVPPYDPELALPRNGLPDVESVSRGTTNGTITTTTTTVTTMGGNQSHEGTLGR